MYAVVHILFTKPSIIFQILIMIWTFLSHILVSNKGRTPLNTVICSLIKLFHNNAKGSDSLGILPFYGDFLSVFIYIYLHASVDDLGRLPGGFIALHISLRLLPDNIQQLKIRI